MSTVQEYRNLLLEFTPRPIRSQGEHERALAILDKIMRPHPSAATSQLIELLSTLIESYESKAHPTPTTSPDELLKHLIAERGASRAEVAGKTGIGAATLRNVLAGRRSISKANSLRLASCFRVTPELFFEARLEQAAPGS